jgi:hypothetical protein
MDLMVVGALLGGLGGLLLSFLFVSQEKRRPQAQQTMETNNSKPPPETLNKRLSNRWSFKLAMVGVAMGIFTALGQGYPNVGSMIGFAIPYALILGVVGMLIDFIKRKRGGDSAVGGNATSKWMSIVAGLAALVVIGAILIPSLVGNTDEQSTNDLTPVQKEILRLSAETNKRLPMPVDSETVLVTTVPQSDDSFVYKYKLVNIKAGEIEPELLTRELKPPAVAAYKTSMKDIRDLGIRLVYHYSDKDGNFVGSFTVGPED